MSHRVHSFPVSIDHRPSGVVPDQQLTGSSNSFIRASEASTTVPADSLATARAEEWRARPSLDYAPGTLSPLDIGYIDLLGQWWPHCRFYLVTFVFKNGPSMTPVSISNWRSISDGRIDWRPDPSKYDSIFEKTLRRKLEKLAGCAPSKGELILFVREFEDALIPGCSPTSPDHIHCIVGVPMGCNHQRLVRDFRKAFVPGRALPGSNSISRLLASAKIEELLAPTDVEKTYSYDRKRKWHKAPCDPGSPTPSHHRLEMDPAHRRMVPRIGELLELSPLKSVKAARQELGRNAQQLQPGTIDPAKERAEVLIEIFATQVQVDSNGLAYRDIEIQAQQGCRHLEKALAGTIGSPVRAVIVERYPSGGIRRVAADPCRWLVTSLGAGLYRLVRQDKYARTAATRASEDVPPIDLASTNPAPKPEQMAPAQGSNRGDWLSTERDRTSQSARPLDCGIGDPGDEEDRGRSRWLRDQRLQSFEHRFLTMRARGIIESGSPLETGRKSTSPASVLS